MLRIARLALRELWCPLENPATTLPVRHWRWMWLAVAVRPLLLLITGLLLIPYLAARGLMWLIDLSGNMARINVSLLEHDLERSGWEPPKAPRIMIRLRERIP